MTTPVNQLTLDWMAEYEQKCQRHLIEVDGQQVMWR